MCRSGSFFAIRKLTPVFTCVCVNFVCVCVYLLASPLQPPCISGPQTGGLCSMLPSTVFFLSLHALPLFSSAGPAALLGSVPLIWVSLTLSRRSQSLISRAGGHQQQAARPIIGPSPPVSREMADVSASNLLFTHETRRAMGFVSGKLRTIISATCIIFFFLLEFQTSSQPSRWTESKTIKDLISMNVWQ